MRGIDIRERTGIAFVHRSAGYLDQACADNTALRRRVEALLLAHDQSGDLLDAASTGDGRPARTATSRPAQGPARMRVTFRD